jgi:hypothetical protein
MMQQDYERQLDAIERAQSKDRWRRRGFWALAALVLLGSLGLLQVVSRTPPEAPAPTPVASVQAPAPQPPKATQATPAQPVQARKAPAQPAAPKAAPESSPTVPPAYDAHFCGTVGTVAGVIALGRDTGRSLDATLRGIATDPSPDAMRVMQEIATYAYMQPGVPYEDVHQHWEQECQARLVRQTASGETMRRFRDFALTDEARRGLWPPKDGPALRR